MQDPDFVRKLHQVEIEKLRELWPFVDPRPEPIYPPLPEAEPGSPIKEEWDLFRAKVDDLIRDGKRGKYALVRVGHPITVWDTLIDALRAAQLVPADQRVMVQRVLPYVPQSINGIRR